MSHAQEHGRFIWTELLSRDPEAAVAFYCAVLGWTTETMPMAEGSYTMWAANGAPHSGLFSMPEEMEARASWLPYVGVDDVDGAVLRCMEEGGAVLVEARELPGVGRFAVLADPSGVSFAVYRSANPQPPAGGLPPIGEFSWRELATTGIDRACDFLQEMFGWERGPAHDMGPAGVYQLLVRGGSPPFAGLFLAQGDAPPSWTSYVRVADLEATVAAVERHGGGVMVPPMDVPGGDRIAVCSDPEGAFFGLHWIGTA